MTMTLDDLRGLLDKEGLKYFVAPDAPVVMAGFGGMFGDYQVVIKVEVEGRFLQLRTIRYLGCPADHGSLHEVLKVMAAVNYQVRLVKLGWDPTDGEIVAYADIWLEDNHLTPDQLRRMLGSFLTAVDLDFKRLKETIETGRDPGEVDPSVMLESLAKEEGGSLPPELAEMLKKRRKGGDGADDAGPPKPKVETL